MIQIDQLITNTVGTAKVETQRERERDSFLKHAERAHHRFGHEDCITFDSSQSTMEREREYSNTNVPFLEKKGSEKINLTQDC